MTLWLISAVLAPLFWAFGNVLDAAIRRNFVKNDLAMTWFIAVSHLPLAIPFFAVAKFEIPSPAIFLGLILAGIFWTWPFFFYYKALAFEETSRVVLLIQLTPIFLLIIAFFTIDERLTGVQGLAFAMLLLAGIFASLKRLEGNWHFSKAFLMIASACALWALSDVFFKKYAVTFSTFWSAFAPYLLASSIPGFLYLLLPKGRTIVKTHFSNLSKRAWRFLIIVQIIGTIGSALFAYALTVGKASLTGVLMGTQPLFAIFWSILLSRFFPEIEAEKLDRNALIFKGISFLFVLGGLILLSV